LIMSYRDELGQAHERIAQLEEELRDEREKSAKLARTVTPRRSRTTKIGLGIMGAGVIVGALLGFFALRNARSSSGMLVKPVDDVVRDQAHFRNSRMRVYGDVLRGTFAKQEQPCEVWMVLEKRGVLLTVHQAHCMLPGLFKPEAGMAVTAEGELRSDGTFEASEISLTK